MTVTISPELEAELRQRAEADGVSVDTYIERLVRADEGWREFVPASLHPEDPERNEIAAAVERALEQALKGESRPAEEVFAELRRKHGISR